MHCGHRINIKLIKLFSIVILLISCKSSPSLLDNGLELEKVPVIFDVSIKQDGPMGIVTIDHNLTKPTTYYLHLMVSIPGTGLQDRIDDFEAAQKGNIYKFYFPEWLLEEGGIVRGIISVPGHKGIKMPNGYVKKRFFITIEPISKEEIKNIQYIDSIPKMK